MNENSTAVVGDTTNATTTTTTTTTATNGATNGNNYNMEVGQSNQDLILTKGNSKKRTWIIAGVVCAIIVALVVAAIVLLTNGESSPIPDQKETLALEDFLKGHFNPESFNATWVSGSELLYVDSSGNLVLQTLADKSKNTSTKIILPYLDPLLVLSFQYELSADRKYLLVANNYQKIYRHSYKAEYTIVNLESGNRTQLSVDNNRGLQLVQWSPVDNGLVIVYERNIFYKPTVESTNLYQITSDSQGSMIYNGIPDWVYEEEVFSSNKALWFSPDGKQIVYGKFNDLDVQVMVIPIYGEPGSSAFQYPRANIIRYPKAGTNNPTVSLHVVNLTNVDQLQPSKLVPPINLSGPILCAVSWATNEVVAAIWMNRVQNEAMIISYDLKSDTTQIITSISEFNGWIELFTPPIFNADGSEFVVILSHDQKNNLGAYRHITLYERTQNSNPQPLTSGAYVVTEILGWNTQTDEIFYLANTEEDSAVQHLYSVVRKSKQTKCLTCEVKTQNGQGKNCLYNNAQFSKDFTNYVLTCAGPDVPEVSLYNKDNVKLMDWTTNGNLRAAITNKLIPTIKRMTFEIADGFTAKVSLKLPPNLDTSGATKYAMLVNVYGGPDSYQVVERFNIDWGSYLAANKSIIYATIDGRGSGLRGDKLLFSLYKRLGTVEIEDQVNVTALIQKALPYVDASRTAIWGWSYGGYSSGMALATDNLGVFKCGISVAPVTDWQLYDSIYTERFMGLPTINDNYKGYANASLLRRFEGLRDKEYYLIHGTHDDNVHYQQSMMWSKVLEQNDILFRQQSYPDEDHALASVRPHLYHSLEEFLDECFIEKEI